MILGAQSDPEDAIPLDEQGVGMDAALEALYDADKKGGLGGSSPKINRWLGDIRKYFPKEVVQVMQRDALDRLGLKQLLLEPELLASIEPDVHLAAVLLQLGKTLPDHTRETARGVVRKIVEDIQRRLRLPMIAALGAALHRASRGQRPRSAAEVDWHRTIRQNLRHYRPELGTIIPEKIAAYGRRGQAVRHIILLADQSGSMATSVVYAGVFASVLASMSSLKTNIVAFDTAVADLTPLMHDPIELLFGTQLGGGTDIHKALRYAQSLIVTPRDTIVVLISDLYEGGNRNGMLQALAEIQRSGARCLALLALNDEGAPSYDHENASALAQMGIAAFACTPEAFPEILAKNLS